MKANNSSSRFSFRNENSSVGVTWQIRLNGQKRRRSGLSQPLTQVPLQKTSAKWIFYHNTDSLNTNFTIRTSLLGVYFDNTNEYRSSYKGDEMLKTAKIINIHYSVDGNDVTRPD